MTVKPTTPLLPQVAPNPSKTTTSSSGSGKTPPTRRPPAPWTWRRMLRVVRYLSLYYLVNVIGLAVSYEGFVRLGKAGNVDIAARGRATCVIAAGNVVRMVATSVANLMWPTRHNLVMLEFIAVTVVSTLYIFNTIDLC
ncbi:hypothetical protein PR202_gb28741 [Eleusine coracana subsp. coracana]|uniref:Uncharacterized protein n=1 Tax=Eleusine coracana subsp. coracana TaxID=191504 RepID=A0AAV5FYA8_ELECO|nr:hypothetical protein PR202_gb28741 [Eleusine coracana subsp. coracana]